MIIHRVKLPLAQLQAVPEPERSYFVRLGHFVDEVNILHKLLLWSVTTPISHEVEERAHLSQTLLFTRLLCGKLYEGRHLLKFGCRYASSITEDGQKALQELKGYFAGDNLIKTIRNKFGFHTDEEPITEIANALPTNEDYEFLLGDKTHSSLYFACDVVANLAFLAVVDATDVREASRKLLEEFSRIYVWYRDFGGECMVFLTEKFFSESFQIHKIEKVTLPNQRKLREVFLPLFVETD